MTNICVCIEGQVRGAKRCAPTIRKHLIDKYKADLFFVIQNYEQINGKYICVGQQFEASDQVDREDLENNLITVDTAKEVYFPFDMKQP